MSPVPAPEPVSPSDGGGGGVPGRAAPYTGSGIDDPGTLAGEVRDAYDADAEVWKLYQWGTAWTEVTEEIILRSDTLPHHAHEGDDNDDGLGLPAPGGSLILFHGLDDAENELSSAFLLDPFWIDWTTLWGGPQIDLPASYVGGFVAGSYAAYAGGAAAVSVYASKEAHLNGTGAGGTNVQRYSRRKGGGDGDVLAGEDLGVQDSSAGNIDSVVSAKHTDTATGTSTVGWDVSHHAGGAATLKMIGDEDSVRLVATGLPTADPHILGQVWNSAGALKISTG